MLKMNDCKGIMGKIFGHKFKSIMVEQFMPDMRRFHTGGGYGVEELLDKFKTKRYKVICVRCGEENE